MSVAVLPVASPVLAPTILDLEASGFGRGSYPIEIGFVEAGGLPFCSLIQPAPEWEHWDEQAEALHGITRELLLRHGRPREWVVDELNRRLAGQTVYSDSWGHDYPWMSKLFDSVGRLPRFRIEDLRRLLSEEEAGRWNAVQQEVRAEAKLRRHRASADAKVLQMTLMRLKHGPLTPTASLDGRSPGDFGNCG
ncbi:3'-5' exonuclease [Roseateles chitinivorans]|uniref:3'-5' exonuclease n=1 Tax=Roseateles chitinivorans TaxID=2917965 RepID=UPI003D671EAA